MINSTPLYPPGALGGVSIIFTEERSLDQVESVTFLKQMKGSEFTLI